MTALAIGSSATVVLGDGGAVVVATNGGMGSVVLTPTIGAASTEAFGPAPFRKVYTFSEGGSVVVANQTAGSLDYDYQRGGGMDQAVQALVSGAWIANGWPMQIPAVLAKKTAPAATSSASRGVRSRLQRAARAKLAGVWSPLRNIRPGDSPHTRTQGDSARACNATARSRASLLMV